MVTGLKVKQSEKILRQLAFLYLVLESCVKPVFKYFEWHQDGLRINFTFLYSVILLTFLLIVLFRFSMGYSKRINPRIFFSSLLLLFVGVSMLFAVPSLLHEEVYRIHEFILFYMNGAVVQPILYMLAGFYVLDFLEEKKVKTYMLYAWSGYVLTVFVFANIDLNIFQSHMQMKNENHNYLMMADAFVLSSMFVFSSTKQLRYKLLIFAVSFIGLYFLKSRASLYVFSFVCLLVLIKSDKRFLLLVAFVLFYILIATDWQMFLKRNASNRMFRVLLGHDASANMRVNLLREGVEGIKENWFLGDFMGDVKQFKGTGRYIHNFLSYWRQFGLIPFLMFLLVLIINYFSILKSVILRKWTPTLEFLFMYGAYVLALTLFARSFMYSGVWLVFAAVPIYLMKSENNQESY